MSFILAPLLSFIALFEVGQLIQAVPWCFCRLRVWSCHNHFSLKGKLVSYQATMAGATGCALFNYLVKNMFLQA